MRAQGGDQIRVLRASSQRVAHEDVVDQFLASPIDAAEALGFGDPWGEIPQPLPVAVVGLVEAATTQILNGPTGSEIGTGGFNQPDHGDRQRLWIWPQASPKPNASAASVGDARN